MVVPNISGNIYPVATKGYIPSSKDEQPKRVRIGPLILGVRNLKDPDKGAPNPTRIRWRQGNVVNEYETPGDRPKTECTIDDGLWNLTVEFNTQQKIYLDVVRNMKAGPYMVETYFNTCCMRIIDKTVDQVKGTKDRNQTVTLVLKEANDA